MAPVHDFTELDFVEALERLPAASGVARLLFAAVSLAAAEIADDAGIQSAVFEGAAAFVSGVLLAVSLRNGEAADLDRIWLSEAAAEIKDRGRHAVIAEHCDLFSVATIERGFAHELASQIDGLTDGAAARLREALARLFESGLALGLRDDL